MSETTDNMNEGVKIILERLKEFPGDFASPHFTREAYLAVNRPSRWRELVETVMSEKEIFTEEERKAVRDAMRQATRKHFSAQVLELLSGKDYSREETIYQHQEKMRMDSSGNLGLGIQNVSTEAIRGASIGGPPKYTFYK